MEKIGTYVYYKKYKSIAKILEFDFINDSYTIKCNGKIIDTIDKYLDFENVNICDVKEFIESIEKERDELKQYIDIIEKDCNKWKDYAKKVCKKHNILLEEGIKLEKECDEWKDYAKKMEKNRDEWVKYGIDK
jgi:thiamine kinase-like enzyme